jgi:PAS domain S-box-containing protein
MMDHSKTALDMKIKTAAAPDAAELRRQAETKLNRRRRKTGAHPATETNARRLVHELEVHKIELEMQNDKLMRTCAEVEALLRQYADLSDFAPAGYFTLARDGMIHQVNLAGANLLGVERGELIKRRFGSFVSAETRPAFNAFLGKVFENHVKEKCEVALARDGRETLWIHLVAASGDGHGDKCSAVAVDINARKQAEVLDRLARDVLVVLNRPSRSTNAIGDILRLIKTDMNFEAVEIRLKEGDDYPYFETNGFPEDFLLAERYLCERDPAGHVVRDARRNPALKGMCGKILSRRFDPTLEWFTEGGSFWANCMTELRASTPAKERPMTTRNRCAAEGYESVALIPLHSGGEIIGLLQFNDRRMNRFTGDMIRFFEGLGDSIGIALKRMQAEERIRKDLIEKEVMLREIHHRVRNNLNVITSLLSLQADRISTKRNALTAFEETKNRIYAMALVHSNLYMEGDFSRIDFKKFAQNMARNLTQVYVSDVQIDVHIDEPELDINNAVPCGLILNELVTNALQHAFGDRRKGIITIDFSMLKGSTYELTVQDNGVGLPKEINGHASETLGLLIVNQLVGQMDGILTITRGNGTRFQITFPVSGT